MDCSLFFLLAVWACTESFISQATAGQMEPCPDSILGNERRGSCPKSCQTDQDCPGRRKCLCDGQCGLSCVTPGRTCPWPLPLNPNTVSRLLSPTPSFSSLLETRCQPGFAMAGGLEAVVRRCQGDRRWSGKDPTCTGVFCPPPVEVDQGYLVAVQRQEYEVGEAIYYLCKKTFLLDGPNRVTCQSNGTWSKVPFCRARCRVPAQRSRVIVGGLKLWPSDIPDGTVQHGENVTFYCKHPEKECSFTAVQSCFDEELPAPDCYLEPTWLQYKIFPHRLVSEIKLCDSSD